MELRYGREVTVGFLVIAAIAIFVAGTMWLSGRSLSSRANVRIQFTDVGGLKRAAPVWVSGAQVGKVERIELEAPGKVMVLANVDDRIALKRDAWASIKSQGALGDVVIDLRPGSAPEPLGAQVIVGQAAGSFFDKFDKLGDRADSALLGVQAIANQRTADQLTATLETTREALRATQRLMTVYGNAEQGPTAELVATMRSFRQTSARLDTVLATPGLRRALERSDTLAGNLAALTAQFARTEARLDSLLDKVNRGEGTIGKLATDSTLYHNMTNAVASMDSLINTIKRNPGKIPIQVRIF